MRCVYFIFKHRVLLLLLMLVFCTGVWGVGQHGVNSLKMARFTDKSVVERRDSGVLVIGGLDTNALRLEDTLTVYKHSFLFDTLARRIMVTVSRDDSSVVYDTIWVVNENLFKLIYGWVGYKYKYAGNGLNNKGIDCSALTQMIYGNCYQVYIPRSAMLQYADMEILKLVDLREGDLVFFKTRRRRISHVGVYLSKGYFFHSSSSYGVTISNINSDYYRKRFRGGGRK